ncbi:MAG: DUF937 domain-containing protein [Mesorhizobium sp.]|nr:DUF937 domain-containing protein [Mesorhizobium sp.]MBN9243149.1 DUF937 domain-containing protein [Mesorhizobium sp.]
MLPLFDMLSQAQNGRGMELLARQFNLSQQQAQLAVEALLPAFSQGLKRTTSDPYGLGGFLNALASGQYGRYFDNAGQAFSQQGVDQGNDVLGQLFGSKDLSRAVAAQAAQATGIGQQVLQQMLPVIASMVMGGLFKQSTGQAQSAQAGGFGGANNPLGQIIEEMMKQGGSMMGGQPAPQQRQAPQGQNPFDPLGNNPFGKVLQDMFGGAAGQAQPQREPQQAQNPLGDNPWGKILQDMLGGGQQAGSARPQRTPQPEPGSGNTGDKPRNPYDDIFGKMFETGRQQRDDYEKNMGSVFDQFLRGMDR